VRVSAGTFLSQPYSFPPRGLLAGRVAVQSPIPGGLERFAALPAIPRTARGVNFLCGPFGLDPLSSPLDLGVILATLSAVQTLGPLGLEKLPALAATKMIQHLKSSTRLS